MDLVRYIVASALCCLQRWPFIVLTISFRLQTPLIKGTSPLRKWLLFPKPSSNIRSPPLWIPLLSIRTGIWRSGNIPRSRRRRCSDQQLLSGCWPRLLYIFPGVWSRVSVVGRVLGRLRRLLLEWLWLGLCQLSSLAWQVEQLLASQLEQ